MTPSLSITESNMLANALISLLSLAALFTICFLLLSDAVFAWAAPKYTQAKTNYEMAILNKEHYTEIDIKALHRAHLWYIFICSFSSPKDFELLRNERLQ